MKTIKTMTAAAGIAMLLTGAAFADSKVVAKVNGVEITEQDLDFARAEVGDQLANIPAKDRRRDLLLAGLADDFEVVNPGGSFYVFPKVPWGTGTEFVTEAIRNKLLIIPGNIFSRRDTHFRISYAAAEQTIERGIDVLRRLAKGPGE